MCFSSHCLKEFYNAYHHNVIVKRSSRLIVLVMLGRPTDLYADDEPDNGETPEEGENPQKEKLCEYKEKLRQYLRQYTYIHYRADDWLDKLLYALPLRGLLQHNEDPNDVGLLQLDEDRNDDVPLGGLLEPGVRHDNALLQGNDDPNDDDDVQLLENIQLH